MTPSRAPIPFLGTWELIACESSRPDLPHPTSGITTFTQQGDSIQYHNEAVWSDGRKATVSARLHLDGTWSPVTGSMMSDSLSFQCLEDGSFEARMKKNGVEVGTTRSIVSANRRTLTGHWEITGPDGSTITWKTISERR